MPRRRLLLTVPALLGVALAVTGCTIPTTKDGKGYGPSSEFARQRGAAEPGVETVELRSGARAKLSTSNASWNPSRYVTAAGAAVVLDVVNDDSSQHNFTFDMSGTKLSRTVPPTRTHWSASRRRSPAATGSGANTTSRRCRAG